MGNATSSCAPSIISSSGVVKVLSSDGDHGRLEVYTKPVKAAELMMEKPGHFLCNSTDLKVGQRIAGVSADEELQLRQLYFLLPMDMLYSVLTHEEFSSLTHKASKSVKHGTTSNNHFSRIFPQGLLTDFCMFPSSTVLASPTIQHQPVQRYSRQRSWSPALETIAETPSSNSRL